MKKLLVPVDFSEQSINALKFAIDIAEISAGSIELLHVITLPVVPDSLVLPVQGFRQPLLDELEVAAEKELSRLSEMHNNTNIAIRTKVAVSNHVHDSITSHAQKGGFDTIIMGTKGASGVREWVTGSNAERIVRTSPVPVIAIKEYKAGSRIKHIVFPNTLDLSHQEDLIMNIKRLQEFFQARLHIIWINTPSIFKEESLVREQLNAFAKRYMLKNYTVNVFNYTDEEAGILEFTKQIHGDLIAMGTHGLRGLAHILSGSIAEDVVNHVQYPVWTYATKSGRTK